MTHGYIRLVYDRQCLAIGIPEEAINVGVDDDGCFFLEAWTEYCDFCSKPIWDLDSAAFRNEEDDLSICVGCVKQAALQMDLIAHPRSTRVPVPAWLRKAVFARDGEMCRYCGSTSDLQIDHVIPASVGGPNCMENLVTACRECNMKKLNRAPWDIGMTIQPLA